MIFPIMLAAMAGSDQPPARPMPRAPEGTACRAADGRIRLSCLPPGTVRPMPHSVLSPEAEAAAPAKATPKPTAKPKRPRRPTN